VIEQRNRLLLGKMSRILMTDNFQDQPEDAVGKSMAITGQ
jgi:hypothetical protein